MMSRVTTAFVAAALAALVTAGAAASKPYKRLYGAVGPDLTLTLKDSAGKAVTKLVAGIYILTIRDRSTQCNFHFVGPGLNYKTGVSKEANASWYAPMGAGTYKFYCDTHRSQTLRFFHVA